MFNVIKKSETPNEEGQQRVYTVFGVQQDAHVFSEFLIWGDDGWEWVDSEDYRPVILPPDPTVIDMILTEVTNRLEASTVSKEEAEKCI